MATQFIQVSHFFRCISICLLLLLAGCITSLPYPQGVVSSAPNPVPTMRAPKVGQEWVYQVRNVFNGEIVDTVTEKVVSVGNEVRIARSSLKAGSLPDEVQSPWGYVLQDPHWNPPQKFQGAIPLWPEQFNIGRNSFYRTRYQVLGYPDGSYYWGLSMSPLQWDRVSVPAGQFLTLKYRNELPYFQSQDIFRVFNNREEELWLSPEVGRWVIRRSIGRYLLGGMIWDEALWEDYLEWQLISWK